MMNKVVTSDFWHTSFFGNTLVEYGDALIYLCIALVVLFVLQKFLMKRLDVFARKTKTHLDDVLIEFVQSIRPHLYILFSIYIAVHTLHVSPLVLDVINIALIIVILFQVTRSAQIIIEFFARKMIRTEADAHVKSAAHLLNLIMIVVVWILGIMMILSNIGFNITSLIAGVGIGGIAIAFAIKEILADLFSSFSIYFDKPFIVGDVVKVGDDVGTVRKIGIKTTRIESRTGEELVIPNQVMTSERVRNYRNMKCRYVRIDLTLSFDTPTDELRAVLEEIAAAISAKEHVTCKRSCVKEMTDLGFLITVLYVVDVPNYVLHVHIRQDVNLCIKDILDARGIALASPVQIVKMGKDV